MTAHQEKNMSPQGGDERRGAVLRLRSTMAAVDITLGKRMAHINAQHCTTARDGTLAAHIHAMKRSLVVPGLDDEKSRRVLMIIGESNSGKTKMVEHALKDDPAFEHYIDLDGGMAQPLLRLKAPSPCTLRNLAVQCLSALGYPVRGDIKESRAWPLLLEQIKARKVLFVVIDEAQRAMKIDNPTELQKVSDTFIELVDRPDWPVRLILMGVSPLEVLRKRDPQMKNRSRPMRLTPLTGRYQSLVSQWIQTIITEHAELKIGDIPIEDFADRLIHACEGNAGSIILTIRSVVEIVLQHGRDTVRTRDFGRAYHAFTGCAPEENIFENDGWGMIQGGMAKVQEELEDDDGPDAGNGMKPLKPLKYGDRPR
jgi:hypothetical protein